MAPYILFNTEQRQLAKPKVAQNIFKDAINSNFRKTMENVRNRRNIQLVCDPLKLKN